MISAGIYRSKKYLLFWIASLIFVLSSSWVHGQSSILESIRLPSKNDVKSNSDDTVSVGDKNSQLFVISIRPALRKESNILLDDILELEASFETRGARVINVTDTSQAKFLRLIETLSSQTKESDSLLIMAAGNFFLDKDTKTAIFTLADNIESSKGRAYLEGFDLGKIGDFLDRLGLSRVASVVFINKFGLQESGVSTLLDQNMSAEALREINLSVEDSINRFSKKSEVIAALRRIGKSDELPANPTLFRLMADKVNNDDLNYTTQDILSSVDDWTAKHDIPASLARVVGRNVNWPLLAKSADESFTNAYVAIAQLNNQQISYELASAEEKLSLSVSARESKTVLRLFEANGKDYDALIAGWNKEGMLSSEAAFQLYRLISGEAERILQKSGDEECKHWILDMGKQLEETRQTIVLLDPKSDRAEAAGRKQFASFAYEIQFQLAEIGYDCLNRA